MEDSGLFQRSSGPMKLRNRSIDLYIGSGKHMHAPGMLLALPGLVIVSLATEGPVIGTHYR